MLRLPHWLQRLIVAAAQSLSLVAMLHGDGWRGYSLMAGAALVLLLAPLLPMQGLGQIPARKLWLWTAGAAVFLFGVGFYQHWRAADDAARPFGFLMTAMAGTILFIGQSLLLAHAGRARASYRDLYQASWSLFIQVLLCGLCALGLWAAWRAFPAAGLGLLAGAPFAMAAMTQVLDHAALRRIECGLAYILAASLPALLLFSVLEILSWSLSHRLPPLALSALVGVSMITAINASYRDGGWRPEWRRRLEFGSAILLLPVATFAALALHARVAQFGFTAGRVLALALVLLLCAYALAYTGAALISLGGGRAMERLEIGNLAIAFMMISLLGLMVTPLADPVKLAVAEQSWRLTHGVVAPAKFDYAWLSKSGLRFGHEALARLPRP